MADRKQTVSRDPLGVSDRCGFGKDPATSEGSTSASAKLRNGPPRRRDGCRRNPAACGARARLRGVHGGERLAVMTGHHASNAPGSERRGKALIERQNRAALHPRSSTHHPTVTVGEHFRFVTIAATGPRRPLQASSSSTALLAVRDQRGAPTSATTQRDAYANARLCAPPFGPRSRRRRCLRALTSCEHMQRRACARGAGMLSSCSAGLDTCFPAARGLAHCFVSGCERQPDQRVPG